MNQTETNLNSEKATEACDIFLKLPQKKVPVQIPFVKEPPKKSKRFFSIGGGFFGLESIEIPLIWF
jgi:hypothetical protein